MKSFILSFKYAFTGLFTAFKSERNLKVHVLITILVVILGLYFNLHIFEWIVLILAIGVMIAIELINTAIERTVDLVTKEYHPLAKQAKDISAAACLLFAGCTMIIGLIIFIPKILTIF